MDIEIHSLHNHKDMNLNSHSFLRASSTGLGWFDPPFVRGHVWTLSRRDRYESHLYMHVVVFLNFSGPIWLMWMKKEREEKEKEKKKWSMMCRVRRGGLSEHIQTPSFFPYMWWACRFRDVRTNGGNLGASIKKAFFSLSFPGLWVGDALNLVSIKLQAFVWSYSFQHGLTICTTVYQQTSTDERITFFT